jgi:hypothetical protein
MKITDFDIEQFILGEVESEKRDFILNELNSSSELRSKVEKIKLENVRFLEENPAHLMVTQIENKSLRKELDKPLYSSKWLAIPTVTLVLLMTFIIPSEYFSQNGNVVGVWSSSSYEERIKGEEFSMQIHRKTSNSVSLLSDSMKVSEGDLLQISIKYLVSTFAAVLSVDGRGVVTTHFPNEGYQGELKNQGLYILPFSYELDDAPKYEKFYLITSDAPIDLNSVSSEIKEKKHVNAEQEIVLLKGDDNE